MGTQFWKDFGKDLLGFQIQLAVISHNLSAPRKMFNNQSRSW